MPSENVTIAKRIAKSEKILDDHKKQILDEGEKLALDVFANRVVELQELIDGPKFSYARLPELTENVSLPSVEQLLGHAKGAGLQRDLGAAQDNGPCVKKRRTSTSGTVSDGVVEADSSVESGSTAVYKFVGGTVPCNEAMRELVDLIKPMLIEAIESVNKVKMWITILIPRIEDGNNFGVSIQEETLSEVRTVESEVASFLDQISRYFLSRGKMVTKLARYPHVADYRKAIADLDEKQFVNLRLVIIEVRNHYMTLHDLIVKNFEKIKKPRNAHMEHMF